MCVCVLGGGGGGVLNNFDHDGMFQSKFPFKDNNVLSYLTRRPNYVSTVSPKTGPRLESNEP